MAEVKAYAAYLSGRNTSADVVGYGGILKDTGHTEWVNFEAIETQFAATFPPNTRVSDTSGGMTYDVDFSSNPEGQSLRTGRVGRGTRHSPGRPWPVAGRLLKPCTLRRDVQNPWRSD